MNYRESYNNLVEQLTQELSAVETTEAADSFVVFAASRTRSEASTTPEFYIGEFLNIFKRSVENSGRAELAACEQAVSDAKLEADTATVVLQARMEAINAVGDQEAEHALWREREERQVSCQAKVDAASRRIAAVSVRIDACVALASELGHAYT